MQAKFFDELVEQGKKTLFGRNHDFAAIKTYEDFKKQVPIKDTKD
jgi:hypothetical protein